MVITTKNTFQHHHHHHHIHSPIVGMYLAIPMVTGRMSVIAMGTSWYKESGASEENTRRARSNRGELEDLEWEGQ